MKKIYLLSLMFVAVAGFSQEEITVQDSIVKPWIAKGNADILFNQSTFDNWLAGGENNISGTIKINYDINYKKEDWNWDNKIIASYGLVKTKTSSFAKKTDDQLEINSLLGKKLNPESKWFYSAFLNFKTQITKGYLYGKDANGSEIRNSYTDFMSPGYLLIGPGLLWKRDDNLKVNLAPLTSKFTFVDAAYTTPNEGYFGVEEGKSMRYELGFNASAYYKLDLVANVTMENILNLYSNYLEDFQNVDLDYQMNINMKINRFLTTNFSFQTIYDDNAFQGFQTRQVLGVGATVNF
ncbi:MAG: DUF3078 domain-containing protein [Flavobacterium sp.]